MAFQLPPNPKFQQFDTNGNPLTGGKLYTYLAGSSDPVSTYTDSSGATANPNPVILDARGEADVWISDNVIYKFVLTDASDVEIWSVDNISAAAGGSGGGGGNDEFVRVTGADLASQYLSEKMAAGTGISLNVLNAGGVEQLQIVSSADLQGVTDNGSTTTNNITVGPNFTLTGGGELGAIALSSTKTNITNINNSGLTIDNLSGSGGASSVLLSTTGSLQAGSPGQNLVDIYLDPTVDKGAVYTGLRGVAVDTADSNRLVEYDIPSISGQVDSVVAGNGIAVDDTDAANPIVSVNRTQGIVFGADTSLKLGPHYLSMAASGVYSGGTLSVSTPTPDGNVNISALEGFVIDTSNFGIDSIVTTPVSTNAIVHPISAGSLVNNVTYILIDSTGSVVELPSFPTPEQRRDNIFLGVAVHPDNTTVTFVNNLQDVSSDITGQLHDLSRRLGFFNIEGNGISANGANLSINKAAGTAFKTGVNYSNNSKDPDTATLAAKTLSPLRYRTQTGVEDSTSTTVIRPGIYDNAGTETAIPGGGNQATIQRIYVFPSNEIRIQAGQTIYSNVSDAIDAIGKESFVTDDNIKENALLLCQLVVRKNATDLSDSTQAVFFQAGRFGEVGSVGSALTGTLQNAYDNSIDPEIITDSTRSALTLRRGSAADTDNVIEVQNGAGATTWSVNGDGDVSANTLVAGGNIKSDKFVGIGDTARDNTLSKWGTQSRFYPIATESLALFGDNQTAGGGFIANAYYDGTNWRSLSAGYCRYIFLSSFSGLYVVYGYNASVADEIITWTEDFRLSASGELTTRDYILSNKDLKADRFVGIGDTERDNALTDWSSQTRLFPFITEGLSIYGDNVLTTTGGITTNAYSDGTNWRSLSIGECQYQIFGSSGTLAFYSFTATSSDQIITWNLKFSVNKDGDASFYGKLNLGSTTNASPTNGDIWYDGTDVNIQGTTDISGVLTAESGIESEKSVRTLLTQTDYSIFSRDSASASLYANNRGGGIIQMWLNDTTSTGYIPNVANEVAKVENDGTFDTKASVKLDKVLNLASYTNSTPVEGDLWYDGTNLKFRDATTTRTISWT